MHELSKASVLAEKAWQDAATLADTQRAILEALRATAEASKLARIAAGKNGGERGPPNPPRSRGDQFSSFASTSSWLLAPFFLFLFFSLSF
jgi:hypothetical protein